MSCVRTPTDRWDERARTRRADLDWLRVLGILVVFAIHVAEPFNPWDAWHVQSAATSKWLGEVVFLPAPWIMPLFMVLAGESAWLSLEKRPVGAYVRDRVVRIGLPFVLGMLLLVPPQVYVERRWRGQFAGSFLDFYPHFFRGVYPEGNFTWHNLWFLAFLVVFAVATAPLFAWLRGPAGRRALARLAAPCEGRLGLAWMVLPVVGMRIAIVLAAARFPPLAYDWSNRGLLLPAFIWGYAVAGEPGFRRALDRHWRAALAVAVAASVALCAWAWPGHVLDRLPAARSPAGALVWGGYACATTCWLVALLGGARRHLTRGSELLARASELVYPFYVLHHGVVIALAAAIVRWDAGVLAPFLALAAAALAVTLGLCWIVESWDPLRLPFGLRPRRRAAPARGASPEP
jgi:glucan biosynthesis protein C